MKDFTQLFYVYGKYTLNADNSIKNNIDDDVDTAIANGTLELF